MSEAYVSSCSVITDSAGYIERDNGSDHRVRTMILQAEKTARKPDFACIALLSHASSFD